VSVTEKEPSTIRQPAEEYKAPDWMAYIARKEVRCERRRQESAAFNSKDEPPATRFTFSQALANVRQRREEKNAQPQRFVRRPIPQPAPSKRAEAATCEPAMVRTASELVPDTVRQEVDTPQPAQQEQPQPRPRSDSIEQQPTEPQPAVPEVLVVQEPEPMLEAAQPELDEGVESQSPEDPASPAPLPPQPHQQEIVQVCQQTEESCASPAQTGSPVATVALSPPLPPATVSSDPEPFMVQGPDTDDMIDVSRDMSITFDMPRHDTAAGQDPVPSFLPPAVVAQAFVEMPSTPEEWGPEDVEMIEATPLLGSMADVGSTVVAIPVPPAMAPGPDWTAPRQSPGDWFMNPVITMAIDIPLVPPMPPSPTTFLSREVYDLPERTEIGSFAAVRFAEPFKFEPPPFPAGGFDFGNADYPPDASPVADPPPIGEQQPLPQPVVACLLAPPTEQPSDAAVTAQSSFTFTSEAPTNAFFFGGAGPLPRGMLDTAPFMDAEEVLTAERMPMPAQTPADERDTLMTGNAEGEAQEEASAAEPEPAPAKVSAPVVVPPPGRRPMAIPASRKAALERMPPATPEIVANRA